jgi:hypothetical protein
MFQITAYGVYLFLFFWFQILFFYDLFFIVYVLSFYIPK